MGFFIFGFSIKRTQLNNSQVCSPCLWASAHMSSSENSPFQNEAFLFQIETVALTERRK